MIQVQLVNYDEKSATAITEKVRYAAKQIKEAGMTNEQFINRITQVSVFDFLNNPITKKIKKAKKAYDLKFDVSRRFKVCDNGDIIIIVYLQGI